MATPRNSTLYEDTDPPVMIYAQVIKTDPNDYLFIDSNLLAAVIV